jgi:thioredoxin-related protein
VQQNGLGWTFGQVDEAMKLYQVQAYPTTSFIDRKGNVVDKIEGGMDKAAFEEELAKIL